MKDVTKWSRDQYHSFILVYAAHADLQVNEQEKIFICEKVGKSDYRFAEDIYEENSDYENVQMVVEGRKHFYPSENDKKRLESEIKTLFAADHEYGTLEENLLMALHRVL
jgi:hypothetical protein